MITPRVWLARFLGLFRKRRLEQDLNDELQFHFQQEVDHLVAQGMNSVEARLAAQKRFGGLDRTKETYRGSLSRSAA